MVRRCAVVVRQLAPSRWRVLRELRLAALADAPRAFLCHLSSERERTDDQWQALSRTGVWLVAETANEPAGLAHCIRDPDSGDCYLESMWVSPTYRQRGVASQLLHGAEPVALAGDRRAIFLWVLDGNDRARAFYLRRGLVATGRKQPIGHRRERVEEEFRLDLTGPEQGVGEGGRPVKDRFPAW